MMLFFCYIGCYVVILCVFFFFLLYLFVFVLGVFFVCDFFFVGFVLVGLRGCTPISRLFAINCFVE